jgi:nitrite reductase/ring-hydroxylating ferredoxin subunit
MKRSIVKNAVVLFFMIGLIFTSTQCKKDKTDEIPYVYVNFYINPTSTQYLDLNNIGGYVYVTGGVRGIIIYHRSVDEFLAYERNCPYQPSNDCAQVEVDNSGIMTVDSCCGSKFLLTDGSVSNGPATRSLKTYQTSYDGTTLHVFN